MRFFIVWTLALMALGAGSLSSLANLGDTLSQSIARYGEPVSSKGAAGNGVAGLYAFQKGLFIYEEVYSRGIAWQEVVWKPDRSPLSESEQQDVLKENAELGKWDLSKPGFWFRNNNSAFARYVRTTSPDQPCNFLSLWQKR